jgi:hypothetical protein
MHTSRTKKSDIDYYNRILVQLNLDLLRIRRDRKRDERKLKNVTVSISMLNSYKNKRKEQIKQIKKRIREITES